MSPATVKVDNDGTTITITEPEREERDERHHDAIDVDDRPRLKRKLEMKRFSPSGGARTRSRGSGGT